MRSEQSPVREAVVLGIISLLTAISFAGPQQADKPVAPAQAAKADAAFKAVGKNASITILPAGLAGSPSAKVGEVIGMILEQAGMTNLELSDAEFRSPEKADLAKSAAALAEFVRAHPPTTDFVLFADFLGSPGRGVDEVRTIVVDKKGEIAWQDRQGPDDADFKRIAPKEPLQCCLLVVERLRPVLGLSDPNSGSAAEGKLAKRWQEKTGLPSEAEQAAMKDRLLAFKKSAATATVLVYPAHAGDQFSKDSAASITKLLTDGKVMKAKAAEDGPQIAVKGDMNEQKVLWSMARAVREHVRKSASDADYILFADYLMGKDSAGNDLVGGVHFVVCDRAGEWVIVDFQNSHHDDFQSIQPKSRGDCDRLVVKRLAGYCR